MASARVGILDGRRSNGEADSRAQKQTRSNSRHLRLLKAARQLVLQWRRMSARVYEIPPGAILALCEAIDDSHDNLKGDDE
jgi:hypothetical protein